MDIGTGIALGGLAIAFVQLRTGRAEAQERKRVALGEVKVRLHVLARQLESWTSYDNQLDGETGFAAWYLDKVRRGALYEPHYNAAERRFHELTPLAQSLSTTPRLLAWEAFEEFLVVSDTINDLYLPAAGGTLTDEAREDLNELARRLEVIVGKLRDAHQFQIDGWAGFWKKLGPS